MRLSQLTNAFGATLALTRSEGDVWLWSFLGPSWFLHQLTHSPDKFQLIKRDEFQFEAGISITYS